MKLNWDKWLYGLGSAVIGGGSSAVVGGIVSALAFHVDVTTWAGALKIVSVMLANFFVAAFFSMFFFLKQSPLPPPANGNGDSNPRAFTRNTVTEPTQPTIDK